MAIKIGDIIKVQYTGTLDDGTVFDSNVKIGNPLKFEVGAGKLIKGFDNSVIGKEVGEEYAIELQPDEAYGEYNPAFTQQIPITQLPKSPTPEKGMMLQTSMGPGGQTSIATITEVTDDTVTIDINHPMAGKVLNFKIKILETGCEPDAPSACGCGCGCGHD